MDMLQKYINCKNKHLLSRKNILEPLALILKVNPKHCKNRNELVCKINNVCTYNTIDPISLENIDDIKKEEQIDWWQNRKRFVCNVMSLKMIFDSGNTMNPWTIDHASGIDQAKDNEKYKIKYDLKHVKGLYNKMCKQLEDLNINVHASNQEDVPDNIKHFFEFDNICGDMYTTHVAEFIQRTHKHFGYKLFIDSLKRLYAECRLYNDIQSLRVLNTICKNIYDDAKNHTDVPSLKHIIEQFKYIKLTLPNKYDAISHQLMLHMCDYL